MEIAVKAKMGYEKEEVLQKQMVEKTSKESSTVECENYRWLYILAMPLMWALVGYVFVKKMVWQYAFGKKVYTNTFLFDGLCRPLRAIKEGAASWRALDLIYNYFEKYRDFHPEYYPDGLYWYERVIADFWIGMMNAQAVRNRRKYVAEELSYLIKKVAETSDEVRIFSIASGSAQAVFEAIQQSGNVSKIGVTLLDLDETALVYSQDLAKKMGINSVATIHGNTGKVEKAIEEFNPHIIEMVGFLDYRPNEKAVKLFQKIYRPLMFDGYFITANVCPNAEMRFLEWVINWKMIHRDKEVLEEILKEGGFCDCSVVTEPQGIHAIAIAQK